MIFDKLSKLFLDIFFPPICVICGEYIDNSNGEIVCDGCLDRFIIKRYSESLGTINIIAVTDYRDQNIKKLIRLLKYNGMKEAALTLGKLLVKRLSTEKEINPENAIIVPIPLHPAKERKRGYNQSELISFSAGKIMGITVNPRIIRRIKAGNPQAETPDYEERAKNIKEAFAAGKENGAVSGK
ncbi:MAG: hypothetical protein PHP35_00560, partial [Candidatus Colwellbacteria bacterium]|nr:hypothetical protein [Candidatus Colwellbacteria bacterium]